MKSRLLVIDDEPQLGRLVALTAAKMGFTTDIAQSVTEFREVFLRAIPTLVVTDLMMPDEDGLDVLSFLSGVEFDGTVLIMSGADMRTTNTAIRFGKAKGLRMGGHINKPLDMTNVKEKLGEYMPHASGLDGLDLAEALERNQLMVHYQPKVGFGTGAIKGVEALVRWNHPQLFILPPHRFIGIAENEGQISQLTNYVMNTAFADIKRLHDEGFPISVAVNLSPLVLREPGLTRRIEAVAQAVGLSPGAIILEITESAAMTDPVQVMEILTRLRLRGFDLAIDDFGTGYSSMVELRRLPFGELKIDQSFVMDLFDDDDAPVIVRSIIALGKALGMKVVAEGVETREMFDALKDMDCDICQGYFTGRPMPFEALHACLRDGTLAVG